MSYRNPRPKRAADEFAKTSLLGGDQSAKKRKFDYRNPSTLAAEAPEEDAILDLDEIGKSGPQTKRNAVQLDGYDSDSSTENFDTRAQAKADEAKRGSKSQQEEANDMFASLDEDFKDGDEDEDLAREGKKAKKEVRFLEENEIEGQVSTSKAGGHVSADFTLNATSGKRDVDVESSSDSGDDLERDMVVDVDEELGAGAKKKHAPKLDAFNMRNEAEEGRFDESGNFVRNAADPLAVHDSWLEGSSKQDIKKAKEAHAKREEARRQRDIEDDSVSTGEVLGRLLARMDDGETILEALARLGTTKSKKKTYRQRNKMKTPQDTDMDVDVQESVEDQAEVKRKQAVEDITAAADMLLTRGQAEIYEAERAVLIRQYRRETGKDWIDQNDNKATAGTGDDGAEWEYRWADARDGGEIHGPYDADTMRAWNEAGYFGEGVEYRRAGVPGWTRAADFAKS